MGWQVSSMQIKIPHYIKWSRTCRPLESSTKIRFGKNVPDSNDQAENTIVFNASNTLVEYIGQWEYIHGTCKV
jgi:hypothetical protein